MKSTNHQQSLTTLIIILRANIYRKAILSMFKRAAHQRQHQEAATQVTGKCRLFVHIIIKYTQHFIHYVIYSKVLQLLHENEYMMT